MALMDAGVPLKAPVAGIAIDPPQTEAIDEEPLDSVISETTRIE